jgi:hypothetical protein
MDLAPHLDQLTRDVAGHDETLAERLESTGRLVLLGALSAAAGEITRDLAPGSVEVRLRGLDPEFVVTPPPTTSPSSAESGDAAEAPPAAPIGADDGATSRINFRPPEQLKARIEAAAGREGLSINQWLVRAVSTTLAGDADHTSRRPRPSGGQSFTGWVR